MYKYGNTPNNNQQRRFYGMQLSARNQLKGRITQIKTDGISSEIILDIGGQEVCSNITTNSVNNLGIKVGDEAYAVVKASSVMIMK
jgi:molybdopterin-binding protein